MPSCFGSCTLYVLLQSSCWVRNYQVSPQKKLSTCGSSLLGSDDEASVKEATDEIAFNFQMHLHSIGLKKHLESLIPRDKGLQI